MCDVLITKPLRVATFNCRGVFAMPKGTKHPRVLDLITFINTSHIDIMGLQEPHLRVAVHQSLRKSRDEDHVWA